MKNRTLFVLMLALCPLATLTFSSLWDFFHVPPRSAPEDKELLQSVSLGARSRQNGIRTAQALGTGLSEVHLILPLPSENSAFLDNMNHYGSYAEDLQYTSSWCSVFGNLSDTLQPLRRVTSESLADMENVTPETLEESEGACKSVQKARGRVMRYGRELNTSLEDLRSKNADVPLAADAEGVCLKITEMVSLVAERVDRSQEIHDAKIDFLKAEQAFQDGKFQNCQQLCRKVLNCKQLSGDFLSSVQELNFQARAQIGLTELEEIASSTKRLVDKIEKIEDLSEKVLDAGKGLDQERRESLGGEFYERLTELYVGYIEESYLADIQSEMEDLKKNPPATFTQSVREAGDIFTKIQEMDEKMRVGTGAEESFPLIGQLRDELRAILTDLLDSRLPGEVEANDKIQEAEMRDGRVVTGYFHPVEENGKTTGYKIYASYEEYQNPTGSKGVTSIDEFHVLPGPSLEARCAEDYQSAREKLMANLDRRSVWNEFLGRCERMSEELAQWEEKSQLKAQFSVKTPLAIAKGTLKEENWSIMNKIFK